MEFEALNWFFRGDKAQGTMAVRVAVQLYLTVLKEPPIIETPKFTKIFTSLSMSSVLNLRFKFLMKEKTLHPAAATIEMKGGKMKLELCMWCNPIAASRES